jgi:GntR family transcriptional repressor for pyruvate dehydrogenase complex
MTETTTGEDNARRRPHSAGSLAARLEVELLSGRPPAGTKLDSERQLAHRFGVSRPMIREALRGLAERGLIEIMPGRGAYARNVELADAVRPLDAFYRQHTPTPRALIRARLMLERETAQLAAHHATQADLQELQITLDQLDQARDLISRARADLAFHTAIARASHNPVIETMFHSITKMIFEQMLRSLADPHVSREGIPYHHEILNAIHARDPQAAGTAMVGHLNVALRTYGNDLDQPLDLVAQRTIDDLVNHPRP